MTPEQLKASILQYAIQGKLVEQRPEEGNAEELYKQIQEEKQKLIKEGKIKKEKPLAEITEDEIPFDIPENWTWVRVGDMGSWASGATPSRTNPDFYGGNIPWLKTGDLNDGYIDDVPEYITELAFEKTSVRLNSEGSVLMAMYGATIGKLGILNTPMTTNQACCACITFDGVFNRYLFYFLMSQRPSYIGMAEGGAQPNISKEKIVASVMPLPPLEEQHRIVAKIEELLPFVDRYAASYEKLEHFNAKFPEDMKKSILQYAIQGKLVEQRPEEGSAEELYKAIQEEKQKLIKEGKIKKEKPLAEITEDETPFDIPESWKWCRLGDCTSYSQPKEKISPTEITNDMWSLDLEDIEKNTGKILAKTFASERKISGDKVIFHKGQVLYSKLRPYLKKILVAPNAGICTPELVPFNTYGIDAEYISYVLKSPHVDYVINTVTYGVKMPRVGTDTMVNLLIPLPPLEEQHRIVAKIKELLPYCDRLISE